MTHFVVLLNGLSKTLSDSIKTSLSADQKHLPVSAGLFKDGEPFAEIAPTGKVITLTDEAFAAHSQELKGSTVTIVQSTGGEAGLNNMMHVKQVAKTLRDAGAKVVTGIFTYMTLMRQDHGDYHRFSSVRK